MSGTKTTVFADAERAQLAAVRERVDDELARAGGWLGFADYMRLVLYAPGLGYYSAGATKFGAAGDFVTAPEISPLFALALARHCAQLPEVRGGTILELGAGTGALADGLLCSLRERGHLPNRYLILEPSADLASRQRERLARLPVELAARIEWLTRLPAAPFSGALIANEVADALPVERFEIRGDGGVDEIGIGVREGRWRLVPRPARDALAAAVAELRGRLPHALPAGYRSEICLELPPWIASLASMIAAGSVLLIDYGFPAGSYYHPDRSDGTLRCHFRHRAHDDPLLHPGLQDITAWVDFSAVATAAAAAGLRVDGFVTQAAFLAALGQSEWPRLLAQQDDEAGRLRLASQMKTLLLPGEMGEAFKVMQLGRGPVPSCSGFALQDLRYSL
ncbi:MAG: SAM-dependent methyltransferase [Steroidobacteraceae bacterium]